MRDILLIMSDQHTWLETGYTDSRIETPELCRIAQSGAWFEHCYSNAPLCVPSRMSFLTGQMPADLEIFDNDSTISSDMPTIAHEFGRMGYHTALIGRMHFKGDDQMHGFDERLCGDITSQFWGTGGRQRTDFGIYAGTTNRLHCLEAVGAGESPVTVYDRMVFEESINYLEQWGAQGDERPPLFLIIGFYGPHFPFVCREALFEKYRSRFTTEECREQMQLPALPVYEELLQECGPELARDCRAAYCGMVEQLDGYVGALYDRFCQMGEGRDFAFFYTSDHGEQLGKRRIFGKQTMYEAAVRVPLLAAGTGIPAGIHRETVSLLDVSRTLLALADETGEYGWHQGRVIDFQNPGSVDGWSRIQQMLNRKDGFTLVEAAVNWPCKAVRADDIWYVYDLEQDPDESRNLLDHRREQAERILKSAKEAGCFVDSGQMEQLIRKEQELYDRHKRLTAWGRQKHPKEWASVTMPPGILRGPVRE